MAKRIGIYSGSFDPVHDGHVEFALATVHQVKLDKVYFLPEGVHRNKQGLSHLAHRLAMLKLAVQNQPRLAVLDLPDKQFSVAKTLPRLNHKFANDDLYLLIGSDVVEHMKTWPLIDALLRRMNLVVGLRAGTDTQAAEATIKQLPVKPKDVVIIASPQPQLSSRLIREALLTGKEPAGLEPSVAEYIKRNWLYASPSNSSSAS
ncbi:MAG: nicotinate (nicotinamide) nucleotide adenylyltransferase [Candidatus Saccharimonadales bacterium]